MDPHHPLPEQIASVKANVFHIWRKAWGLVGQTKWLSKTGEGLAVVHFFTPHPEEAEVILPESQSFSARNWPVLTSSRWVLVAGEPES